MTTRYFSATDGTFTVFRATASAAYASASWLGDRPYPYCLGFSRKPAGSGIPGRFPTTEISKAQYDALVAAKQDRQRLAGQDPQRYSSPQDSWVRNADLKQAVRFPQQLPRGLRAEVGYTDPAPVPEAIRTLTWNTKRAYTAEGQVITAQFNLTTRQVIFKDHSRCISGVCRNTLPSRFSADVWDQDLKAWLDCEYLHNRYDYDRTGAAEALQRVEG